MDAFPAVDLDMFFAQLTQAEPNLGSLATPLADVISALLAKTPSERCQEAERAMAALYAAVGLPQPPESSAIRESFLQAAQFVGRRDELGLLTSALEAVQRGQGSVWLVGGESGVGKSRLLDELRIHALVEGVRVLPGQAQENGGLAYQLWQAPVRHLVLSTPLNDLEASVLKEIAPDIERLLGRVVTTAPMLAGEANRDRLITTLVALLQRQPTPVLLLLEDLQWSSEALEPLRYLLRMVQDLPLLIVASYRHEERPDLPAVLPGAQRLLLRRLTEPAIVELSTAMLGKTGAEPRVATWLQEQSEGNTFFMVQLVQAWAEEVGRLDQLTGERLPRQLTVGGVQRLIERRLQRLAPVHHPLLQVAAITGRQLELALLRLADPAIDLDHWLVASAAAALIEAQENQWRFSHDKIRQTILAGLTAEQQRALHQQVAGWIEQAYAQDLRQQYARLAHHYQQAGQPASERRFAQLAGVQAAAQFVQATALTYFNRALLLTNVDENALRFDLLLARVKLYDLLGDRQAQYNDLQALAELADKLDDAPRSIHLFAQQMAYTEAIGDYPATLALAEKVIALGQTISAIEHCAYAHLLAGQALWRQSRYGQARLHLEEALSLARAHQLPTIETSTLLNLGTVASFERSYTVARTLYQESLQRSRQIGDLRLPGPILNNLGILAYCEYDFTGALRHYNEALPLTRAVGDREEESRILSNLGLSTLHLGDFDQAQLYLEEALQLKQAIGDRRGQALTLVNLALLFCQQAKYDQARQTSEEALLLACAVGSAHAEGHARMSLGHALMGEGALQQASQAFQQALSIWRHSGQRRAGAEALAGLARVALLQGNLV